MGSLLDWYDKNGFQVKESWDPEQERMVGPGPLHLFPIQRRILEHLFTFDDNGWLPYTTIVMGLPKKSGKSAIEAMVGAWAAEDGFTPGSEIYVVANDAEQAQQRVFEDISWHTIKSEQAIPTKWRITYPNRTYIQVLAKHYASAAGGRHCVSLWDELWAYKTEQGQRMWAELTPPPTVPNAFRFIATYAGFENESHILFSLYENAWKNGEPVPGLEDIVNMKGDPVCRFSGSTFVMWDDVPRYPWQTERYYEDQMLTLRPADFLRMHRNQWVTSAESFIPIEYYDKCVDPDLKQLIHLPADKRAGFSIVIGVDIGPKHDCSAVVGVGYDHLKNRPFLAFHRIWTPQEGETFDIEATVEAIIIEAWIKMNVVGVVYDPYQFHRSATTLMQRGLNMIEFPQTAGNMTAATQTFYDLMRNTSIDLYHDPDLRDHIKYSTATHTGRGYRIVKEKHAKYAIDAAVAMAMACHLVITEGMSAVGDDLVVEVPFSDSSTMKRIPTINEIMAEKLPPQLR